MRANKPLQNRIALLAARGIDGPTDHRYTLASIVDVLGDMTLDDLTKLMSVWRAMIEEESLHARDTPASNAAREARRQATYQS
jgi:hypothetical protein